VNSPISVKVLFIIKTIHLEEEHHHCHCSLSLISIMRVLSKPDSKTNLHQFPASMTIKTLSRVDWQLNRAQWVEQRIHDWLTNQWACPRQWVIKLETNKVSWCPNSHRYYVHEMCILKLTSKVRQVFWYLAHVQVLETLIDRWDLFLIAKRLNKTTMQC